MRRATTLALTTALALPPSLASADGPHRVRFHATRADDAERCPSEAVLRDAVRARMGADPFADDADARIEVRFVRVRRSLRAELRVATADGPPIDPRVITSRQRDCRALADATALAVSLTIAELPAPEPVTPPAPAPTPAVVPAVVASPVVTLPVERPPVVVRPPPPPTVVSVPRWEVHADVLGQWGLTPTLTGGLSLGASWRRGALSLGVDVRGVIASELRSAVGGVAVQTFAAAPALCVLAGHFFACGVVSVGAVLAEGRDAAITHRVNTPSVRAGARVGVTSSLTAGVTFRFGVEVDAPMTITEHRIDNAVVWSTPPVAVAVAAGVGWRLP
jgi:hypothetical protein